MALLEVLADLQPRLAQQWNARVALRIGIHTGLVVVDVPDEDKQSPNPLVLGETPTLATRLLGLAAPDTVVMSGAIADLVQGLVVSQDLGTHTFTGVAGPTRVWQAQRLSGVQHRLDLISSRALVPLMGREAELTLLQNRWRQVQEGEGQIALLSGDAGMGKSRLVRELRQGVERDGGVSIVFRCTPSAQNSALHPVITHLHGCNRAIPR